MTIDDLVEMLEDVRDEKARIEEEELDLVQRIIAASGHNKQGQKTYPVGSKKIVIKTGVNYTCDKAVLNATWTAELPINREYAYKLREKDFAAIMATPDHPLRKTLADVVKSSPVKPSITIQG